MFKFIFAFILVLFDAVIAMENVQLDLLPDFIGYGIMIYGVWKLKKANTENKEFQIVAKSSMILFTVSMIVSYIVCLLDLYGVIVDSGKNMIQIFSITVDIFGLLAIYMYMKLLEALQGNKQNFQIKAMNTLLIVKILCVACQYIAITFEMPEFYVTFMLFNMLTSLVMLVYMATSAITYKDKYIKNNT